MLIIIPCFHFLAFECKLFELSIDWMFLFEHQAFDHGLYGSEGYSWTGHPDTILYRIEPLGQLLQFVVQWQMALQFHNSHWTKSINVFKYLNVGCFFNDLAKGNKEHFHSLLYFYIRLPLLFILLSNTFLILDSFSRQILFAWLRYVLLVNLLLLFDHVSIHTFPPWDQVKYE